MLTLLLLLWASTGHATQQIHHAMTKEELRQIFHVESHDEVPEYEVTRVRRAKDSEHLRLEAFGQVVHLRLAPSRSPVSRKTPVLEASTNASGHLHYAFLPLEDHVGDTYQDIENEAAVLMHRDEDGNILMEGTIGQELVVKPAPGWVRGVSESNSIPNSGRVHPHHVLDLDADHIVYKRSQPFDQASDYALMEPDGLPLKKKRNKRNISKREAPFVIYPEILVIVDYDGYRLHGGDNVQIKRYFVSFWNGVDLRYKLLKGPKVRISIAGIIISRGRDATPYLERNRVGRDAIDSAAALTDMGKYLFRERRLPVYDIAVAITKYDMCRRRKGGRCTKGTAGMSLSDEEYWLKCH